MIMLLLRPFSFHHGEYRFTCGFQSTVFRTVESEDYWDEKHHSGRRMSFVRDAEGTRKRMEDEIRRHCCRWSQWMELWMETMRLKPVKGFASSCHVMHQVRQAACQKHSSVRSPLMPQKSDNE